MGLIFREKETAPCTVTISHRFEELSAHVRLDNGAVIHPGDTVQVQGPEIMAAFGEIVEELEWRPVPVRGIEPPLPCGKRILNPSRLPIPPLRPGGMRKTTRHS